MIDYNAAAYFKLTSLVGKLVYFIGYGIVEELRVRTFNMEVNEGETVSYITAVRSDGTTEYIGYEAFGELAFTSKEDAMKALNKAERYTKKDSEGNWYIESKNGALTSDVKGRTYGPAIDRLAFWENNEEKANTVTQDIFSEKPLMTEITVSGGW